MAARDFSKVAPQLWRSARFRGLSDRQRLLYLYCITNTHVTSAGCYHLPAGYACSDLGCEFEELTADREALISAGLVDFDPTTDEVAIERWYRHNPIANPKHYTGTCRLVAEIESDRLREKCEGLLDEAHTDMLARIAAKKATAAQREASSVRSGADPTGLRQIGASSHLLNSRLMKGAA